MIEHQTHSIVVVGNMNPRIFHPFWFVKEGLIPESEAEAAKIEVIHPDVAVFSTDWMDIQVTRERFIAKTSMEAFFEPLRDFTIGVFDLLGHTPISALGVNFELHVSLRKEKIEELSDQIVPDKFWKERNIDPQLNQFSMRIDKPKGAFFERYIVLKIQPSKLLESGLFLDFNNHFQFSSNPMDLHYSPEVGITLKDEWESIKKEVHEITRSIIK